jgi:hypothetical protein
MGLGDVKQIDIVFRSTQHIISSGFGGTNNASTIFLDFILGLLIV